MAKMVLNRKKNEKSRDAYQDFVSFDLGIKWRYSTWWLLDHVFFAHNPTLTTHLGLSRWRVSAPAKAIEINCIEAWIYGRGGAPSLYLTLVH